MRIELTYPVWKTDVLAVELHPQVASSFSESGKILIINENGKKIKNNNKLLTGIEPENNLSEAFDDGLTAKPSLQKSTVAYLNFASKFSEVCNEPPFPVFFKTLTGFEATT